MVYRYCREAFFFLYSSIYYPFHFLSPYILSVCLDVILICVFLLLIFGIYSNPGNPVTIAVCVAVPVFVLIFIPVALLSIETPLTKFDDLESTDVVLKVLRKKVGLEKQSKSSFSALALPSFRMARASVLHYDDNPDQDILKSQGGDKYSRDPNFVSKNNRSDRTVNGFDVRRVIEDKLNENDESLDVIELDTQDVYRSPVSSRSHSKFSISSQSPIKGLSPKSPNRQQIHNFFVNSPKSSGAVKIAKLKLRPRKYRMEFPGRKGYKLEEDVLNEKVKPLSDLRLKPKLRGNGKVVSPTYDMGPGFTAVRTIDNAQSASRAIFTHGSLTGDGLRRRHKNFPDDGSFVYPGSRLRSEPQLRETEQYIWSKMDEATSAGERREDDDLLPVVSRNRNKREDIFNEKMPLFY